MNLYELIAAVHTHAELGSGFCMPFVRIAPGQLIVEFAIGKRLDGMPPIDVECSLGIALSEVEGQTPSYVKALIAVRVTAAKIALGAVKREER